MKRKTLQELTIKDNFMFAAVMLDSDNCKGVLERALDMKIDRVEVQYEKSIIYHPEYKGIRLDVYAKDENNRHFNVEMQVASQEIVKRARYYHCQIDTELLLAGHDYESFPDSYVIFICDFDPFGLSKYRYTLKQTFAEDSDYPYSDGNRTVFLSTMGTNKTEVSKELVDFLHYVKSEDTQSGDAYVEKLSASVNRIKIDREMGARFVLLEEMMKDERRAGRAEGLVEGRINGYIDIIFRLLSAKGFESSELKEKISTITDISVLESLTDAILTAASPEDLYTHLN